MDGAFQEAESHGIAGALPQCALLPFATRFKAMGGTNEIAIFARDHATASLALAAAAHEVLRIEFKYSRYRRDSVVSQINANAGLPDVTACDPETLRLLSYADHFYKLSGGLFDVTSGVLRRAWDFKTPRLPEPETLAPLLALVEWERVERSPAGIRLPLRGMEIDFGGIGKEYAADRAAGVLVDHGIGHGYVNLGGDIAVAGPQPDGAPWPIGVQNPRQRGTVMAHIPLARGGLTTSGDAERYFELGGKRYCHILSPKTGMPVAHWASVSVAADSALAAGALSTIAMLKEAGGIAFLRHQAKSFFAVDTNGQIFLNQKNTQENPS